MSLKSWIVIFIVLASLGLAFYFWQDARDARQQTPEGIASRNAEETSRVLGALDKVLFTKSEDAPTVARIEDADVLREANPDFYADAAVGDYLVLYPQRAIIFREAENRVINVAPIINTSQLDGSAQQNDTTEDSQ